MYQRMDLICQKLKKFLILLKKYKKTTKQFSTHKKIFLSYNGEYRSKVGLYGTKKEKIVLLCQFSSSK